MDRPPAGAKIKKHEVYGDLIVNGEELDIDCQRCGSTEDLQQDPTFDEVFFCMACLTKRDNHQEAIDYGYKEEDVYGSE